MNENPLQTVISQTENKITIAQTSLSELIQMWNQFEQWDITMLDHRKFINKLISTRRDISEAQSERRWAKFQFEQQREQLMSELMNPEDGSKGMAKTPAREYAEFVLWNEKTQINAFEIYIDWYLDEWNTLHRHLTTNQFEMSKVDILQEKKANTEIVIDE